MMNPTAVSTSELEYKVILTKVELKSAIFI